MAKSNTIEDVYNISHGSMNNTATYEVREGIVAQGYFGGKYYKVGLLRDTMVFSRVLDTTISIPRKLYEEARRKGVDVESRIVEILLGELGLDPREEAIIHLELAEKYFREAREYLAGNDPVQASEKLYKVAEECIKAMAKALGLEEAEEARSRGRWTLRLLDNAAQKLARKVDQRIHDNWDHAYFLHTEGFHEARLDVKQVEARVKYIEELLETTKNTVGRESKKQ